MPVRVYCMEWHLTRSDSARKLIVEPLSGDLAVELHAWDGEQIGGQLQPREPAVFWQLPPPPSILEMPDARVTWVPMWDHIHTAAATWWESLPRWLRIVAFSEEVERRARAAGLRTLRLRYFADPSEVQPAQWDQGVIVSYWNRTGMVGPRFLERLCASLRARELLFRPELDPSIDPKLEYSLPNEIGGAAVTRLEPRSRSEFVEATERANVVVAPRIIEGVGLVQLEAMARGACVIAFDAPTMNEYIRSRDNGILMRDPLWARLVFNRRWTRRGPFALSHHHPWMRFASLDPRRLGARARADHATGRQAWLDSLPRFREFVAKDQAQG